MSKENPNDKNDTDINITNRIDSSDLLCVSVADGKYTVKMSKDGSLKALRYGEEWRDCCGDGLIYQLAAEVKELRDKLAKLTKRNNHE